MYAASDFDDGSHRNHSDNGREEASRNVCSSIKNHQNYNESHRSHSDNNPVEAGRDGGETRALVNLDEVAEAGKRTR